MKKVVTISFLFAFVFANTDFHQLLKLPLLLHHFEAHHQEEKDKSFTHFLSDHYGSNQKHSDNDNSEHDNLPFKTTDCATAHISLAFPSPVQFVILRPTIFYEKIAPTYSGVFYSSTAICNIWQPPKIC